MTSQALATNDAPALTRHSWQAPLTLQTNTTTSRWVQASFHIKNTESHTHKRTYRLFVTDALPVEIGLSFKSCNSKLAGNNRSTQRVCRVIS